MSSEQTTPTPETDASRAEFEAWISAPPFEHMCDRNSAMSAWPGQYKRYETDIAWRAWQASRAASQAELNGYKADRIAINARNAELYAECERLRVIAREAAEYATRHQADVLRLRDNISTLVAGPMMHHHKMDASDIRAAEAFDRCRELTLANFSAYFEARDAIRAAMQSEQGAQG